MSGLIPKGRYRARAVDAKLCASKEKRTEYVGVIFQIVEGEWQGEELPWNGWLTEKVSEKTGKSTAEKTIESLRICGWQGDDLFDLSGVDANEVEIQVDREVNPADGKVYAKVQWVNDPSRVRIYGALEEGPARAFAERMKGLCASVPVKPRQEGSARPASTPPRRQQARPSNGTPNGEDFDQFEGTDEIPF